MIFDYYIMGIILLPAIILALVAQAKVNNTYSVFSKVYSTNGKKASEVARLILDSSGLSNIKIEKVSGYLTDHFDPKNNVVRLSSQVYDSSSIAAIGIATHEVGHAIQYKQKYFPIMVRSFLVKTTNYASVMLWPLVIIGLIFNFMSEINSPIGMFFIWCGIIIFGLAALLNIVTLPVEFNASNKALKILNKTEILNSTEITGAKKVLSAAALTYLAAMLVAVLNFLRFILVFGRRH